MPRSSLNRRVKRTNRKQNNRRVNRTNRKVNRTNRKVNRTNRKVNRTNRKQNNRRVKRTSRNMYKVGGVFHKIRTSPSRGSNEPGPSRRMSEEERKRIMYAYPQRAYYSSVSDYLDKWVDYGLTYIEIRLLDYRLKNLKWGFKKWRSKKLQAKIDELGRYLPLSLDHLDRSWRYLVEAYINLICKGGTISEESCNNLMINLEDTGIEGKKRLKKETENLERAYHKYYNKSDRAKLPDFNELLDDIREYRSKVRRGNVLSTRDPTPTPPLDKQTRTESDVVGTFQSTTQTGRNKREVGEKLETFMKKHSLDFEFTTWHVLDYTRDDYDFLAHYTNNKYVHENADDYLSWIERVTFDLKKRGKRGWPTAGYNTLGADMERVDEFKGVWKTFCKLAPILNLEIPFFMALRIDTDKEYSNAVERFTKYVNKKYHEMNKNIEKNTKGIDFLLSQRGALAGVNIETIQNHPKYKKLNQRIAELFNAWGQLLKLQKKTDARNKYNSRIYYDSRNRYKHSNNFLKIIQFGIINSTITVKHGKTEIVYSSGNKDEERSVQLPGQVPSQPSGRFYAP